MYLSVFDLVFRYSASVKKQSAFEPPRLLIYSNSGEKTKGEKVEWRRVVASPCFPKETFHSVETYNSLLRTDGIFVESRAKARGSSLRYFPFEFSVLKRASSAMQYLYTAKQEIYVLKISTVVFI